jgi:hypothetical protein
MSKNKNYKTLNIFLEVTKKSQWKLKFQISYYDACLLYFILSLLILN